MKYAPAKWAGQAKCESNFKAFKDKKGKKWNAASLSVLRKECWSCPADAPKRTLSPVTSKKACKRPAYKKYKKAIGPKKPTGKVLKTKCAEGWFLHLNGKCYSCRGYKRTLRPIASAKACYKKVKAVRVPALKRGRAGCPKGSFRNVLRDACYSCPSGYTRSLAIGKDLTKKKRACIKVTLNPPKLRAKPPTDLARKAKKAFGPYLSLVPAILESAQRAQAALLSGDDMSSYRDKKLAKTIRDFNTGIKKAEAERRIQVASAGPLPDDLTTSQQARLRIPPIRTFSVGVVGDATTSLALGGNLSAEWLIDASNGRSAGQLFSASATIGKPVATGVGGDGSVFIGLYTVDPQALKNWSWSVEFGMRKIGKPGVAATPTPGGVIAVPIPGNGPGGDLQIVFGFNNDPGIQPPTFVGMNIAGGVGTPGVEADVGVNWSFLRN
jgi:hypothetical protein